MSRLTLTGLDDLSTALAQLPAQLAAEAEALIDERAELMKAEVFQRYPKRTGNLRKGVRIQALRSGSAFTPGRVVTNRAPHAHIFELGTEARHTKIGARRGAMPPGRVFVPAAIRHRRVLMGELLALLERVGLEVSGG